MVNQEIIHQFEEELIAGKDPKVWEYEKKYGPLDKETHDILILMRAMRQHQEALAPLPGFKERQHKFLEEMIAREEATPVSLGDWVAERRRAERLPVPEVAGRLGLSVPDYQRFEADRHVLPRPLLRKLADLIKVSWSQMVVHLKPAPPQPRVSLAWAARKKRQGKKL